MSLAALVLLVDKAADSGSMLVLVSCTIFGFSLVVTYAISTVYHSTKTPVLRSKMRIMDHASIYILIAGTYTPFTLITLQGTIGWVMFGVSWGFGITGIILKLFFTGHYSRLSTFMYVCMGWAVLFAIVPLMENLSGAGLTWLAVGGLAYSLGAICYTFGAIPFNHAIFHLFTLLGSLCHFMAVYYHVL